MDARRLLAGCWSSLLHDARTAHFLLRNHLPAPENNKARRTEVLRALIGGRSSPRSLSRVLALGASLSRAASSPTPLFAAGRRFRSHGGTASTVSGGCFSSEASMPGSEALCREPRAGQGADTPAMVTFASAPVPRGRLRLLAARWPRGTGLTSYLSGCFFVLQLGDAVFRAAPIRNVYELCQVRSFPAISFPLRAPILRETGAFWRGGPAGKRHRVLVLP